MVHVELTVQRRHLIILAGVLLAAVMLIPGIAYATTSLFADVPDDHIFVNDINWMKTAGVTQGCGDGTNYCPDDNVTRGQMAAFMHRLSGSNSTTLDGRLDKLEAAAGFYEAEAVTEVPGISIGFGATARCDLGDVVSGGGFRWSGASDGSEIIATSGVVAISSRPVDATNSAGEGWSVSTSSDRSINSSLYVVAIAMCAKNP